MTHHATFQFDNRHLTITRLLDRAIVLDEMVSHTENPLELVRARGFDLAEGKQWQTFPTGLAATVTPRPVEATATTAPVAPLDAAIVAALIDFATHEVTHAIATLGLTEPMGPNPAWGREDRARSILRARGLSGAA